MSKGAAAAAPTALAPDKALEIWSVAQTSASDSVALLSSALGQLSAEVAATRLAAAEEDRSNASTIARLLSQEAAARELAARCLARAEAAEAALALAPTEQMEAVLAARREGAAEVDALRLEVKEAKLEVMRLHDAKLEKAESDRRIQELEAEVEATLEARRAAELLMERRNAADRESLRALMLDHVKEMKKGLLEKTAESMGDNMKRMVAEHEQLLMELAFSSKRGEEVALLNQKLVLANQSSARELALAKGELQALYTHSGRMRGALKAAREALAAAGLAQPTAHEHVGQGLEMGELDRGGALEEAQLGYSGLSEALPRQTPVQPPPSSAARRTALHSHSQAAMEEAHAGSSSASASASGVGAHVHFAAGLATTPVPARRGGGAPRATPFRAPGSAQRPSPLFSPPSASYLRASASASASSSPASAEGKQAPSQAHAQAHAQSSALAAALDALAAMEEQKCASEEVGECLTAFLLRAAWGAREALKKCVGEGEGKLARLALLGSSGGGKGEEEGLEALLESLPSLLPGGWAALPGGAKEGALLPLAARMGLAGLAKSGARVAGVGEAALSLLLAPRSHPQAQGSESEASALRQLYATLLAFLRRLRAHFCAQALAVLPEEEVGFAGLLAGSRGRAGSGGGAQELALKGLVSAPEGGSGGRPQPPLASRLGAALPEAELFAALLRREGGSSSGAVRGSSSRDNAYIPLKE